MLEDVNDKDSLIFEDNKKANILQKQFSGVYTKEPIEELPFFKDRTQSKISFITITTEMVRKKLKSLNNNNSCGPDDIHPQLLSELADIICGPLSKLLITSFTYGVIRRQIKNSTRIKSCQIRERNYANFGRGLWFHCQ